MFRRSERQHQDPHYHFKQDRLPKFDSLSEEHTYQFHAVVDSRTAVMCFTRLLSNPERNSMPKCKISAESCNRIMHSLSKDHVLNDSIHKMAMPSPAFAN